MRQRHWPHLWGAYQPPRHPQESTRSTNHILLLSSTNRRHRQTGCCLVQDNNRFVVEKAVKCDWSIWEISVDGRAVGMPPRGRPREGLAPLARLGSFLVALDRILFFVFYCSVAGLSLGAVKCSRAMIWAVRVKSSRFGAYQEVFSTLVYFLGIIRSRSWRYLSSNTMLNDRESCTKKRKNIKICI